LAQQKRENYAGYNLVPETAAIIKVKSIAQIKTIKLSRFTNEVTCHIDDGRVIWSRCEIE